MVLTYGRWRDAPELNRLFKIRLNQAKREYLKFRDASNQRFVSTDVIPLVNMAWSRSFAVVENGKKAIRQRGWGPLNYVLLDHPKLIAKLPEDTNTNAPTAEPTTINSDHDFSLLKINTSGPLTNELVDQLVDQKAMAIGKKAANEEKRKRQQEQNDKLAKLAEMAAVTSGQLAHQNIYTLDDTLLDFVQDIYDKDTEKTRDSY